MSKTRQYGIDVSEFNGSIDWAKVKAAGVNYVTFRAGYGTSGIDGEFTNYIEGAISAGIENIGVYWFTYAPNADRVKVELQTCLSTIAPYKQYVNMPLWYDFEDDSIAYVENQYGITLTASDVQEMATAWVKGAEAAGYAGGVYCSWAKAESYYKRSDGTYLWEYLDCPFWYARYGAGNDNTLNIIPAIEEKALTEQPTTYMMQYSDNGRVDGISGAVDLNIIYAVVTPSIPDVPIPDDPNPINPNPVHSVGKIEYVEIRNKDTEVVGIIDTAHSVIWHSVYYGVGDFEIYVQVTPEILDLLKIDNYVTRPDCNEVGVIEKLTIVNDEQSGTMIAATGRFAKSLLDRRVIFPAASAIMQGNVETEVRRVVYENAIHGLVSPNRALPNLALGAISGIEAVIITSDGDEAFKDASWENLLTYTDEVLQEYELGSKVFLDDGTQTLRYFVYAGVDRSVNNASGNDAVIFSQDYDNITRSDYSYDATTEKTEAYVKGENNFISIWSKVFLERGLKLREMSIDASSLSRTYKDKNGAEQTYSDGEYHDLLGAQAKQTLAAHAAQETFSGNIDLTNSVWIYNRDFKMGDIVTIQDNSIGKFVNVRIVDILEAQDENGYSIEIKTQS